MHDFSRSRLYECTVDSGEGCVARATSQCEIEHTWELFDAQCKPLKRLFDDVKTRILPRVLTSEFKVLSCWLLHRLRKYLNN